MIEANLSHVVERADRGRATGSIEFLLEQFSEEEGDFSQRSMMTKIRTLEREKLTQLLAPEDPADVQVDADPEKDEKKEKEQCKHCGSTAHRSAHCKNKAVA